LLGFRDATPLLTRLQPLLREEHFTVLSAAHYQAVREVLAKNTFLTFVYDDFSLSPQGFPAHIL
jgi:hypothetical protein